MSALLSQQAVESRLHPLVSGYFLSGDRPAFFIREVPYLTPKGHYGVGETDLTYRLGVAIATITVHGWYDLYLPDGTFVHGWNSSTQQDNRSFAERLVSIAFSSQVHGARLQKQAERKTNS